MEMPSKVLSEQEWTDHVNRVGKFKGSMAEYCRQNNLIYESLRIRKKEYNKSTPSSVVSPPPVAFVRVESTRPSPIESKEAEKSYPQPLPDLEWLARFIRKRSIGPSIDYARLTSNRARSSLA